MGGEDADTMQVGLQIQNVGLSSHCMCMLIHHIFRECREQPEEYLVALDTSLTSCLLVTVARQHEMKAPPWK